MSLAGLIPIGSTQHSKNPYWVVMVRSFLDSLHSGIERYPMLRSMTEAKMKPLTSCNISSIVGSGYSFRFRHWLILRKSMTNLIVTFFFGIPNAGEAHSLSSISSALNACNAPMSHCLFNSSLKTWQFLSGTGYGLAHTGLAFSMSEIVTGVPFHSPRFPWNSDCTR